MSRKSASLDPGLLPDVTTSSGPSGTGLTSGHMHRTDGTVGRSGSVAEVVEKASTGRMSPIRKKSVKDVEQQIEALEKENFDLKLRIYFLEQQKGLNKEDCLKVNIDLKVQLQSIQKEFQEKQEAWEHLMANYDRHMQELEERLQQAEGQTDADVPELKAALEEANSRLLDMEAQLQDAALASESHLQAREVVLEQLRRDVADRDTKLLKAAPLQAKVDELTEALSAKLGDLKEKSSALESLRKKVKDLGEQLAKANEHIQTKEANVVELTKNLEQARADLSLAQLNGKSLTVDSEQVESYKSQLRELHSKLSSLQKHLIDKDAVLVSKDQELSARENVLALKDKTIETLQNDLAKKEREIAQLREMIKSLQKQLAEKDQQLSNYRNELQVSTEKHVKDLSNLEHQLVQFQAEIAKKDIEIESLSHRATFGQSAQNGTLEQMRAAILEKDQTIASLVASGNEKDILLARLQQFTPTDSTRSDSGAPPSKRYLADISNVSSPREDGPLVSHLCSQVELLKKENAALKAGRNGSSDVLDLVSEYGDDRDLLHTQLASLNARTAQIQARLLELSREEIDGDAESSSFLKEQVAALVRSREQDSRVMDLLKKQIALNDASGKFDPSLIQQLATDIQRLENKIRSLRKSGASSVRSNRSTARSSQRSEGSSSRSSSYKEDIDALKKQLDDTKKEADAAKQELERLKGSVSAASSKRRSGIPTPVTARPDIRKMSVDNENERSKLEATEALVRQQAEERRQLLDKLNFYRNLLQEAGILSPLRRQASLSNMGAQPMAEGKQQRSSSVDRSPRERGLSPTRRLSLVPFEHYGESEDVPELKTQVHDLKSELERYLRIIRALQQRVRSGSSQELFSPDSSTLGVQLLGSKFREKNLTPARLSQAVERLSSIGSGGDSASKRLDSESRTTIKVRDISGTPDEVASIASSDGAVRQSERDRLVDDENDDDQELKATFTIGEPIASSSSLGHTAPNQDTSPNQPNKLANIADVLQRHEEAVKENARLKEQLAAYAHESELYGSPAELRRQLDESHTELERRSEALQKSFEQVDELSNLVSSYEEENKEKDRYISELEEKIRQLEALLRGDTTYADFSGSVTLDIPGGSRPPSSLHSVPADRASSRIVTLSTSSGQTSGSSRSNAQQMVVPPAVNDSAVSYRTASQGSEGQDEHEPVNQELSHRDEYSAYAPNDDTTALSQRSEHSSRYQDSDLHGHSLGNASLTQRNLSVTQKSFSDAQRNLSDMADQSPDDSSSSSRSPGSPISQVGVTEAGVVHCDKQEGISEHDPRTVSLRSKSGLNASQRNQSQLSFTRSSSLLSPEKLTADNTAADTRVTSSLSKNAAVSSAERAHRPYASDLVDQSSQKSASMIGRVSYSRADPRTRQEVKQKSEYPPSVSGESASSGSSSLADMITSDSLNSSVERLRRNVSLSYTGITDVPGLHTLMFDPVPTQEDLLNTSANEAAGHVRKLFTEIGTVTSPKRGSVLLSPVKLGLPSTTERYEKKMSPGKAPKEQPSRPLSVASSSTQTENLPVDADALLKEKLMNALNQTDKFSDSLGRFSSHEERIHSLQQLVQSKEAEAERLRSELAELEVELNEHVEERLKSARHANEQILLMSEQNEKMSDQLSIKSQEVADKDSLIERLTQKYEEELRDTVSRASQLTDDLKGIEAELNQSQAELNRTQTELRQSQAKLGQLQADLDQSQRERSRSQGELSKAQAALGHSQVELNQIQADLQISQSELRQSQAELNQSQNALSRSQSQLSKTMMELAQVSEELSSLREVVVGSQTRLEQKDIELESCRTHIEQLSRNLGLSKDKVDVLDDKLQASDANVGRLSQELQTCRAQIAQLNQGLERSQEKMLQLTKELNSSQGQVEQMKQAKSSADSTILQLSQQLQSSQSLAGQLSEESKSSRLQIDQLTHELRSSQTQLENMNHEFGSKQSELNHAEKLLQLTQQEVKELKHKLAEANQELKETRSEALNLQGQVFLGLKEGGARTQTLADELASSRELVHGTRGQLSEAREALNQAQGKLAVLTGGRDQLQQRAEKFDLETARLRDLEQRELIQKEKETALRQQVLSLTLQQDSLTRELEEIKVQKFSQSQPDMRRLKSMESQIGSLQERLHASEKVNRALQFERDVLEKSKLIDDETGRRLTLAGSDGFDQSRFFTEQQSLRDLLLRNIERTERLNAQVADLLLCAASSRQSSPQRAAFHGDTSRLSHTAPVISALESSPPTTDSQQLRYRSSSARSGPSDVRVPDLIQKEAELKKREADLDQREVEYNQQLHELWQQQDALTESHKQRAPPKQLHGLDTRREAQTHNVCQDVVDSTWQQSIAGQRGGWPETASVQNGAAHILPCTTSGHYGKRPEKQDSNSSQQFAGTSRPDAIPASQLRTYSKPTPAGTAPSASVTLVTTARQDSASPDEDAMSDYQTLPVQRRLFPHEPTSALQNQNQSLHAHRNVSQNNAADDQTLSDALSRSLPDHFTSFEIRQQENLQNILPDKVVMERAATHPTGYSQGSSPSSCRGAVLRPSTISGKSNTIRKVPSEQPRELPTSDRVAKDTGQIRSRHVAMVVDSGPQFGVSAAASPKSHWQTERSKLAPQKDAGGYRDVAPPKYDRTYKQQQVPMASALHERQENYRDLPTDKDNDFQHDDHAYNSPRSSDVSSAGDGIDITNLPSTRGPLYAISDLLNYETLKKQNEESLALLSGLEARVQGRLDSFSSSSPPESSEWCSMKELKSSIDHLRHTLFAEKKHIMQFYICQLPSDSDASQYEELKKKYQRKCARYEWAAKQLKELYRAVCATDDLTEQMKRINGILKSTKENLRSRSLSNARPTSVNH